MDLREFRPEIAARHPWELARVTAMRRLLAGLLGQREELRVLDLGCGDGFTAAHLFRDRPQTRIEAVDINLTPQQIELFSSRYPQIHFHSSVTALPRREFDLITLFDVLEHVQDDREFLVDMAGYLRPGGQIIITVPAFQPLFSAHDRFLHHCRRYNRRQLRQVVTETGLAVGDAGYLFSALLPVRALEVALETMGLSRGERHGLKTETMAGPVAAILTRLLEWDNLFTSRLHSLGLTLPGLSAWIHAKKLP